MISLLTFETCSIDQSDRELTFAKKPDYIAERSVGEWGCGRARAHAYCA